MKPGTLMPKTWLERDLDTIFGETFEGYSRETASQGDFSRAAGRMLVESSRLIGSYGDELTRFERDVQGPEYVAQLLAGQTPT